MSEPSLIYAPLDRRSTPMNVQGAASSPERCLIESHIRSHKCRKQKIQRVTENKVRLGKIERVVRNYIRRIQLFRVQAEENKERRNETNICHVV